MFRCFDLSLVVSNYYVALRRSGIAHSVGLNLCSSWHALTLKKSHPSQSFTSSLCFHQLIGFMSQVYTPDDKIM